MSQFCLHQKNHLVYIREAAKKSFLMAVPLRGGGKGCTNKEKITFYSFFFLRPKFRLQLSSKGGGIRGVPLWHCHLKKNKKIKTFLRIPNTYAL